MPDLIRVVLVPVGVPAHEAMIENTLAAFRAFVGGYIEAVPLGNGLVIYCNENFIALGLPQNGCGLRGPYLFSRCDDSGAEVGLSGADAAACLAYWAARRTVPHTAAPLEVRGFDSFADLLAVMERERFDDEHRN